MRSHECERPESGRSDAQAPLEEPNKRQERRFTVNQRVNVTILGSSETRIPARIRNLSRSGMRLALAEYLPLGSALKLEWNGHFVLGSVCYCDQQDGSFSAGVQLFSSWESFTEDVLAREAAELARSNAELAEFAYVASHDLKEPLRMVISYLQLLERRYKGKLGPDADDYIRFAVDGAARMEKLIQDLLSCARIAGGAMKFEALDGDVVLREVVQNLDVSLEQAQAKITVGTLPTIVADRSQMIQLFQNLISNSIKFRSTSPPEITVSAKTAGAEWVFSVRDNGIGLDPACSERIFKMFERLHARSEYPGTGIGLAIAKRIVERHGGRIWCESEPGRGATFSFTIPTRGWQ